MGPNDGIEARLRAEREQIVHQLSELGASESGDLSHEVDFGEGFADAAAATAERTEVLGLIESLKRSVEEIDQALARLADGTYGTCANCGKEIGAARLDHRPSSIYCVDCAALKAV
ncbi:MAG: TraR/DksA C4-type zinc finger protein [Acidimicrobiia bacterium]